MQMSMKTSAANARVCTAPVRRKSGTGYEAPSVAQQAEGQLPAAAHSITHLAGQEQLVCAGYKGDTLCTLAAVTSA